MTFPSLKNHLLIAMPALHDGYFDRTVTVICEHGPEGAMGIVVNRLLELTFAEALEAVGLEECPEALSARKVHWGGPVQAQQGFILHRPRGQWAASLPVSDSLTLTTSRDLLEAIARGEAPERFLLALGYAGWGPGQLENEIKENAWLHGPADGSIIFDMPMAERWEAAARLIGVDLRLLTGAAGHA